MTTINPPTDSTQKIKTRESYDSPSLTQIEILAALRAMKRGEFDARLPDGLTGIDGEICQTFNEIAMQASSLVDEFKGLYEQAGTRGKTHSRLTGRGLGGGWGQYAMCTNQVMDRLTEHSDEVVRVVTAVSQGDLSHTIDLDGEQALQGDFRQHAKAVNAMVSQVGTVVREVTNVALQVGVEGQLGAQAHVPGASGMLKELKDSVNMMADNLTNQVREITRVATAVAQGDLTKTITVDVKGEILALKDTINTMVGQLSSVTVEVTRVAREVGTEGILGGQAQIQGLSGVWRELTDNVNSMANNLTNQVRNVAEVATAIAAGDLSKKITVEAKGEILQLKSTINTMVDQLNAFGAEVSRVAREVGSEGVLGGQAEVAGVSGLWRELTENVNSMATNLTNQVRNIAEVVTAIAEGDLSRKITVDAAGEILALKTTINTTVDRLSHFSEEVTRVARLVGTEGTLGVQANVEGVSGIWQELTDNVNSMADNLTNQVRNIAEVTTAVAQGDLSHKITVEVKGEILQLKNTINDMVDSLSFFADEVNRMAHEVGTEGVLGGQAHVRDVSGIWKELTDNVNSMARNLTNQVRNISEVARAVAEGDLSKTITVDAQGEVLELKDTLNNMVDQLSKFGAEVARVAREVGVEGSLGGQAQVAGARGVWKELTDNVNLMASNLTKQVRDISQVATAIASGELGQKVTVEVRGELLELKNTINTMVDQLSSFADEVTRVARDVGVEGKLGGHAEVRGVSGVWRELTENVNLMANNLTQQVRDIAQVTTAVAKGDLSRKITVEVRGELLELKNTINTMVDQLSSFADEVTRVAREVGTEGMLGGQAQVRGVSGTWRELTDNVNVMASNLTQQVRGIARVVTAVAEGDLKQGLRLDAKGEIATLAQTINSMVVTLGTLADQVSGVARDVGVLGKLGGQADVPGAAGIWREVTNNVNELADNLTRQVRAIGDVATAVTTGDLTRTIDVDAQGEVALLKDNINQMIQTLAETTQTNEEQDWLKTNLARFTRMLQGQRDLKTVAEQVLAELAPVMNAQHGSFMMARTDGGELALEVFATYAHADESTVGARVMLGQTLAGEAARQRKPIMIDNVPTDAIEIRSTIASFRASYMALFPVLFEGEVKGVIELVTVHRFRPVQLAFIEQLIDSLGIVIATIDANMRTDELLRSSQEMAKTLKMQQEELRETNEQLEEKARQLTAQRDEVERKNHEVELAKQEVEEKAEQLALTSRYKSDFLANMSHELRTPLNSLLILSRQLADNREGNLAIKQVEHARTIHDAGSDLLSLINEILDLAKIESGTMSITHENVNLTNLHEYIDRSFAHLVREKGLSFLVQIGEGLPDQIATDELRLRQVLRNLISNAIKFTSEGSVQVFIDRPSSDLLERAQSPLQETDALAFCVTDTGIGIDASQHRRVFEAFHQGDGGTSRKYGGTGLGLSISREIAGLLGGALLLDSEPGVGSQFTLILPQNPLRAERALRSSTSSSSGSIEAVDPEAVREALNQSASVSQPSVNQPSINANQDGDSMIMLGSDSMLKKAVREMLAERGIRCLSSENVDAALSILPSVNPTAIVVDISEGAGIAALQRVKYSASGRHVPVIAIGQTDQQAHALRLGAFAVAGKRAGAKSWEKLVEEAQALHRREGRHIAVLSDGAVDQNLVNQLLPDDSEVVEFSTPEQLLESARTTPWDCVVLDADNDAGTDAALKCAEQLGRQGVRAIVYRTTRPSERELSRSAAGWATSLSELAHAMCAYLHVPSDRLSSRTRELLSELVYRDPRLQDRKIMIVDDDVRNLYAITAVLESHGVDVVFADNGKRALERLGENGDLELILMDIMMPEMDGYEAMRIIRKKPEHASLPIIALTAKAMRDDRDKCIAAGASDYVTKPVEPDRLVTLIRSWLS